MDEAQPTVPYGYCHCGCGQQTKPWEKSNRGTGRVRGEPRRYLHGHNKTRSIDLTDAWIVDPDSGCWLWQRSVDRGGYGAMGKSTAHRYVYQLHRGPITSGLHIDHLCRVRHCVNPDHMELVTNAENCRRGSNATLTTEQAREARDRMATGLSVSAAAREYAVTYTIMYNLARGHTWQGV